MIRRSPSELYLKYLLVHPDKYSNDNIRKICRLDQVDYVSEDYLDRLREDLSIPVPFYPLDPRHPRSTRFLYKHLIYRLFHRDEVMDAAESLLRDPNAKYVIETFLCCGTEPAYISSMLRRHHSIDVDTNVVSCFATFYFNTSFVDPTELEAIIRMRVMGEPGDPEEPGEYSAMFRSIQGDPRLLTASSPVPLIARLKNMLRFGFLPSSAEFSNVLVYGRMAAATESISCIMRAGKYDHERSRDYAATMKTMHEVLESVGSPEEQLQQHLESMILKTDTESPPSIHELTEGHHTTDLQPIDDKDKDDSEK